MVSTISLSLSFSIHTFGEGFKGSGNRSDPKKKPRTGVVAGLGVLLECRDLQKGQPKIWFLLVLTLKRTQGQVIMLGCFEIQHDFVLPVVTDRIPFAGSLCAASGMGPTKGEPSSQCIV